MATAEQLDWEARWAKPAAVSAFATVLALIAGTTMQASALADGGDDDRAFLQAVDANAGLLLGSSVVEAISFVALIFPLFYLGRALLARRPELPAPVIWLTVIGPVLLAVAGILSDLDRIDIADEFLASGAQTVERAEDLLDERSVATGAVGLGGAFAVAVAFIFISVNAMRVGLLTRFMGIVGAIIGGLYVIPLLVGPVVVEMFWLVALGVLYLGRWPGGGPGPAWKTGQAIEWPSARDRVAPDGAVEVGDPPQGELPEPSANGGAADERADDGADEGAADGARRRRKRKRRR